MKKQSAEDYLDKLLNSVNDQPTEEFEMETEELEVETEADEILTDELEIKTEDDLTYFEYSKMPESIEYSYFVTVHKTDDAFWYFTFTCEKSLMKDYRPTFEKWARSIVFDS